MLRILGVLSIVFTFHKEQRVKTKWLRTLIKLKILWLQKFGWDAVLQLGMKFNNCKKKKPHIANGKLLGSFISPLIQRYWIYIVPTPVSFHTVFPSCLEAKPKDSILHLTTLPKAKVYKSVSDFFIPKQEWNHHHQQQNPFSKVVQGYPTPHDTEGGFTQVYFNKQTFHLQSQ